METTESIGDFLTRAGQSSQGSGHFNVYKVDECYKKIALPPQRRDYYKISLIIDAEGVISYADKNIPVKTNAILFGNPMIPYSWEWISEKQTGYFCLFTEDFVNHQLKNESLGESPLFRIQGNHVLFPDERSMAFLTDIFARMVTEMESSYKNKYDLMRSYVQLIMHEALKIEPAESFERSSSSARITELFLELLERQFPIATPQHTIRFKNAREFADQLSIHTNHLNKSLKEITGKTTSEHITARLISESRALMLHSSWNIAEIGYCLGFEHPSNFNSFFKKQTGQSPNQFRRQLVVKS